MIFYDTPLPFGKHKGEKYGEVDPSYREWLKSNVHEYCFMNMHSSQYQEETKYWQIWIESHYLNDRESFSTKEAAIAFLEKKVKGSSKPQVYLEAIDYINRGCKWIWISHGCLEYPFK